MNGTELLPTIAEVSVAFAGFASLVSVLGQRHSVGNFEVNVVRLRGMLETSLIAVVFSLAPFLPRELGFSELASWRIASAFFALACATRLITLFSKRLFRGVVSQANNILVGTLILGQTAAVILLALIAVGQITERASGGYLVALFIYLLISTLFFLRLVVALMASQRPAA